MASRRLRIGIGLAGLLVALTVVNASIAGKEALLKSGRVVYLELAPVDPRSLMQGDYMQLNYQLSAEIRRRLPERENPVAWLPKLAPSDGRVVVTLDDRSVARFARLYEGGPLAAGEALLRYRVRAGELRFASDAFFFEEGTASGYENARFGRYRVAADGELLLTALCDGNLERLPSPKP